MGSGKSDDPEALGSFECLVVDVVDHAVLGDALTAVFEIDRSGLRPGDADSERVRASAAEARIGKRVFGKGDITALDDGHGYRIGDLQLRVFAQSGLGALTRGDAHIATLDCRPGAKPPVDDDAEAVANCAGTRFESGHCRYDNGQFAAAICCRPSCAVVTIDDDELEEGLGAIYDLDLVDEETTRVSSDLGKGSTWTVGDHQFAEDAGDVIERRPGLESYFQRWLITPKAGATLDLRVFDQHRLGVIMIQRAGETEPHMLARLDCR